VSQASAISWSALFSWLVTAVCVALASHKQRGVARLAPPPVKQLLRELEAERPSSELDEKTRRLAIAELNQRLADVSFELGLLPSTFAALIRICLASGSGLGLFGFLTAADLPLSFRILRLALAAAAGLTGAVGVALFGRTARARAQELRQKWDASSRDIGKALGTSLESAESRANAR